MAHHTPRRLVAVATGSIAVGAAVLAIKYVAYLLTGSVALYSDALESTLNVATAIAALAVIRISDKPADSTLPYGYSKAEYLAVVLEGILILTAALFILKQALVGFLTPSTLHNAPSGLLVNALASFLNGAWAVVLFRTGTRYRSPALLADAKHLQADILTSLGILGGVALASLTGWHILDPLLAAAVALHILWSGWNLLKESIGGLMDAAVPPATLALIEKTIATHAAGALQAHDIRTRQAGRKTFIQFHLVVKGSTSVAASHALCDDLENALTAAVPGALVTIHVEPETKAKLAAVLPRK